MWKEIDFEIRGRESFGASVTSQRLEPLVVRIRLALHKRRLPDGSVVNRRKPRDKNHLQPFLLASILQRSLVANGRIGSYPGERTTNTLSLSVAQQTEEEVNIGGGIPPEEYHLPQREKFGKKQIIIVTEN